MGTPFVTCDTGGVHFPTDNVIWQWSVVPLPSGATDVRGTRDEHDLKDNVGPADSVDVGVLGFVVSPLAWFLGRPTLVVIVVEEERGV